MDIPASASAPRTCSDLASALVSRIPCAAEAAAGPSPAGARSALVIEHNGFSPALDDVLVAGCGDVVLLAGRTRAQGIKNAVGTLAARGRKDLL